MGHAQETLQMSLDGLCGISGIISSDNVDPFLLEYPISGNMSSNTVVKAVAECEPENSCGCVTQPTKVQTPDLSTAMSSFPWNWDFNKSVVKLIDALSSCRKE